MIETPTTDDLLKNKAMRIIEVNQKLPYRELKRKLQKQQVPESVINGTIF